MPSPLFAISHTSSGSRARRGTITLPHGTAQTPGFMSIGTAGSVKSLSTFDLEALGAEIILGNTYHLWLKPDLEVLARAGGLHAFGGWKRPILTDSGGFQAFSLGAIRKFSEDGVTFKVPASGDLRFLSPEKSMQIQAIIGSDITLVLDELLPAQADHRSATEAMLRTRRWAERSKNEFERLHTDPQYAQSIFDTVTAPSAVIASGARQSSALQTLPTPGAVLFGIPQGAQFIDLRVQSAQLTMELDFPGYSVGGVANGGEPTEVMYTQVLTQTEILEPHKPRHLLGVGTPTDIVQMVARGIDLFDCVYPTRNARHGSLIFELDDYTYEEVQITAQRFEFDFTPLNPHSVIPELRQYTKSYLRHLLRAKELLGMRLATLQNLDFYYRLMHTIRTRIQTNAFDGWWEQYHRAGVDKTHKSV
jgi:queuine tRNA-ribosyltransferase